MSRPDLSRRSFLAHSAVGAAALAAPAVLRAQNTNSHINLGFVASGGRAIAPSYRWECEQHDAPDLLLQVTQRNLASRLRRHIQGFVQPLRLLRSQYTLATTLSTAEAVST